MSDEDFQLMYEIIERIKLHGFPTHTSTGQGNIVSEHGGFNRSQAHKDRRILMRWKKYLNDGGLYSKYSLLCTEEMNQCLTHELGTDWTNFVNIPFDVQRRMSKPVVDKYMAFARYIVGYFNRTGKFPKNYYGKPLLTRWKQYLIGNKNNHNFTVCPEEVNQYLTAELGTLWTDYTIPTSNCKRKRSNSIEYDEELYSAIMDL